MSGLARPPVELEREKAPVAVPARGRMRNEWRPDLYVVARFLERLYATESTYTMRQLQMAVRLNYNLYKKYLDFLLARELVTIGHGPDGTQTIRMAPKGREAYHRFVGWVKVTIGEDDM